MVLGMGDVYILSVEKFGMKDLVFMMLLFRILVMVMILEDGLY